MSEKFSTPPELDETLVRQLAKLADQIDGSQQSLAAEWVRQFNELAGTEMTFTEFQGVYGAEDHEDFVRRILIMQRTQPQPGLGQKELVALFERILQDPTDDAYLSHAFTTIKKTLGDDQISDLVFWPDLYLGDGEDSSNLTPERMAQIVWQRYQKRQVNDKD